MLTGSLEIWVFDTEPNSFLSELHQEPWLEGRVSFQLTRAPLRAKASGIDDQARTLLLLTNRKCGHPAKVGGPGQVNSLFCKMDMMMQLFP